MNKLLFLTFAAFFVVAYIGLIQWVVEMLMKQYDRFDEGDDGETK